MNITLRNITFDIVHLFTDVPDTCCALALENLKYLFKIEYKRQKEKTLKDSLRYSYESNTIIYLY